ncbi:MAG: hypothetical protein PHW33_02505 [Candidatus Portnoybacteria bacterium]|jgi:hypothetical protein|nr:hypothetical protein [Candidatus Portnoybacteria bacterium]
MNDKELKLKNIIRVAVGTGIVLLIPLALTLLNPNAEIYGGGGGGWDWMPGDFLVMGVLLFGTGLAVDFSIRKIANPAHRLIAVSAVIIAFLLVWVELAVGGVSQIIEFIF